MAQAQKKLTLTNAKKWQKGQPEIEATTSYVHPDYFLVPHPHYACALASYANSNGKKGRSTRHLASFEKKYISGFCVNNRS